MIIDENKVILNMNRQKVKLNRPIYLGFTCLELTKHLMYETYYYQFKNVYNDKIQMLYTDTDSMLLEIKTQDFYEDLKEKFNNIMDFSNYDKNHFLYNRDNAKIIGKFKDEFPRNVIIEYIGLKAKLFDFI